MQGKLNLLECIDVPIRSYIWSTIIQNNICLEVLELFLDQSNALWCSDITLECHATFDWWDLIQINADFYTSLWHVFRCHLKPTIKLKELVFLLKQLVLTNHQVQHKDPPNILNALGNRASCSIESI